jgi:hypothetical protein
LCPVGIKNAPLKYEFHTNLLIRNLGGLAAAERQLVCVLKNVEITLDLYLWIIEPHSPLKKGTRGVGLFFKRKQAKK